MSLWSSICDNFKDGASYLYDGAADAWDDGNYLGAISRSITGTLSGVGNTITGGWAKDAGESLYDRVESGNNQELTGDGFFEKAADFALDCTANAVNFVAKNEAESYLIQDDLADGVYNEYEFSKKDNCFVIAKDKDGNLKSYKAKTKEEKDEFKKLANTMGGVDLAGQAVDLVTLGVGGKATATIFKVGGKQGVKQTIKVAGKEVAKEVVEEGVETGVKQTIKVAGKEVAKEVVEEGVETGVKQTIKVAGKEVAKEVVEEGLEEGAEQIIKVAGKEVAKEVVEEGLEEGAEQTVKNASKVAVVKKFASNTGKALKTDVVAGFVVAPVNSRLISGQVVADYAMNGTAEAITGAVKDVAGYGVDQAEVVVNAAQDVASSITDSWLAKHPLLGKFVNTCKSAYYATTKSFTNNKVGALAVATVAKPLDKIKSVFGAHQEYQGISINEMANQFKAESTKDNKKWTDHYVERVKKLDAELGLDSSTRSLVAREDSISSDAELGAT